MKKQVEDLVAGLRSLDASAVEKAADLVVGSLKSGGKIMLCGNGGSAADCQHFAAELVGRFAFDRPPMPAVALTTDTSTITAVSNDYSYSDVFSRQVQAIGRPGDALICISTSGGSDNVVKAAAAARAIGVGVISLVGSEECELAGLSDVAVCAKCARTCRTQECFLFIEHYICERAERALYGEAESPVP